MFICMSMYTYIYIHTHTHTYTHTHTEQNRKIRKVRRREERGMRVSPKGALQSRDKTYT